jgi:esterase/lipase
MSGMRHGANFLLNDVPAGIEIEAQTLTSEDNGSLSRGLFYRPSGKRPKVGVHIMHPKNDQSLNYNILPLVKAGYAALGRGGRWTNNDIATTHEHLLLDVAAGVRRLRELGCERVILLGNSGGGGLASFYQSQACKQPPARLTTTPAGDAIDLNKYDLPPADGIVLIGAHPGEGISLNRWLDPSVVDEADMLAVDPELDMYSPDNGFRVPPAPSKYASAFLAKFRMAQGQRAHRLDELAWKMIRHRRQAADEVASLRRAGKSVPQELERRSQYSGHLRMIRTLAYPGFVDPSIEPEDERDVCSYSNGPRPDLDNYRTFASAFLTPEAYLSTWSGLSSRAHVTDCLAEVGEPLIVVHYRSDSVCHTSDARAMLAASAASDKQFALVPGADHYGYRILGPHQRGDRVAEGTDAVVAWLERRFPVLN